jgi:hypothetical protein
MALVTSSIQTEPVVTVTLTLTPEEGRVLAETILHGLTWSETECEDLLMSLYEALYEATGI